MLEPEGKFSQHVVVEQVAADGCLGFALAAAKRRQLAGEERSLEKWIFGDVDQIPDGEFLRVLAARTNDGFVMTLAHDRRLRDSSPRLSPSPS